MVASNHHTSAELDFQRGFLRRGITLRYPQGYEPLDTGKTFHPGCGDFLPLAFGASVHTASLVCMEQLR